MTMYIIEAVRNVLANAMVDPLDGGHFKIYDGSVPADCDEAIVAQNVLVDITLPTPAFGDAAAGVASKSGTWSNTAAQTGTATFYRIEDSSNNEKCQGSVGTSGENLNLSSVSITSGGIVTVSTFTHTQPK